jgi:hypothetical protein
MTATVEEQDLRCLLAKTLQLNGASELIIAKTLGYVEGIQDTRRQVEQQDAPQTEETKSE